MTKRQKKLEKLGLASGAQSLLSTASPGETWGSGLLGNGAPGLGTSALLGFLGTAGQAVWAALLARGCPRVQKTRVGLGGECQGSAGCCQEQWAPGMGHMDSWRAKLPTVFWIESFLCMSRANITELLTYVYYLYLILRGSISPYSSGWS